jgi:predicted DNA-binding transcriptional regulator YafY
MTRRADRLFDIIQLLRRARAPLTAAAIAEELETSPSTIYRDMATLIARQIPIVGEAGTGYVLDRSFDFPPLGFTPDEIQATVLGAQWVEKNGDPALARAASSVLSKLSVVVPAKQRALVEDPVAATAPPLAPAFSGHDVAKMRSWCQEGWKASIRYEDRNGQTTERTIWPFLVGYQDGIQVVIAWCELRHDFRVFRMERIAELIFLDEPYAEKASVLRARYLSSLYES